MGTKHQHHIVLFVLSLVINIGHTTNFTAVGAADSGGAGYKIITGPNTLVVSNNVDYVSGIAIQTFAAGTDTYILKADGLNAISFDVVELEIASLIFASGLGVGTQIVFKDSGGMVIRTMTLNAEKAISASVSIGAFFDNNNTLPVTGVSQIEMTIVTGSSNLFWITDLASQSITLTNVVAGLSPEMNIQGNAQNITDGDVTPDTADHTDFGSHNVGGSNLIRTFTIQNSGTSNLNLTGGPIVAISGSSDFSVTTQASSPIASGGGSTTFQVTFDPTTVGTQNASISIANNDADENPYNFSITAGNIAVTYTALADLCLDAGVQTGLGGGTPTGGTYSGPGTTDDGNGMTYSFNPAAAGVGTHTLTYTVGGSAMDSVEVFALPTITFTALADLVINAGVQTSLGGGSPVGGVYSGPGVTDDANGMTYSFDPAAAGVGTHTITYSFTNGNGCSGSASDNIEIFGLPMVTFTTLADLPIDSGVQAGLGGGSPTGGVYSGSGVTDDGNGMTYSFDPTAAGVGVHTITYTFTDGNGATNSASDDVEVTVVPPRVTSATYDGISGDLVVTGTDFVSSAGSDVDVSRLTIQGEAGVSFTLSSSSDVEITNPNSFTVIITDPDKAAVDILLNKVGIQSDDSSLYNLAALDDWMTGSPLAINISDGLNSINVSNPTDTIAPTFDIIGSLPLDDAIEVPKDSNIVISFNENVQASTVIIRNAVNDITIRDVTGGVDFETFDLTTATATTTPADGQVGIVDNKVYINPTNKMEGLSNDYAILITATAIEDIAGNSFIGISDETTFNFTTIVALSVELMSFDIE